MDNTLVLIAVTAVLAFGSSYLYRRGAWGLAGSLVVIWAIILLATVPPASAQSTVYDCDLIGWNCADPYTIPWVYFQSGLYIVTDGYGSGVPDSLYFGHPAGTYQAHSATWYNNTGVNGTQRWIVRNYVQSTSFNACSQWWIQHRARDSADAWVDMFGITWTGNPPSYKTSAWYNFHTDREYRIRYQSCRTGGAQWSAVNVAAEFDVNWVPPQPPPASRFGNLCTYEGEPEPVLASVLVNGGFESWLYPGNPPPPSPAYNTPVGWSVGTSHNGTRLNSSDPVLGYLVPEGSHALGWAHGFSINPANISQIHYPSLRDWPGVPIVQSYAVDFGATVSGVPDSGCISISLRIDGTIVATEQFCSGGVSVFEGRRTYNYLPALGSQSFTIMMGGASGLNWSGSVDMVWAEFGYLDGSNFVLICPDPSYDAEDDGLPDPITLPTPGGPWAPDVELPIGLTPWSTSCPITVPGIDLSAVSEGLEFPGFEVCVEPQQLSVTENEVLSEFLPFSLAYIIGVVMSAATAGLAISVIRSR